MLSTRIVPPFTAESAAAKVQMAADAWNSKDPERVAPGLLVGHGAVIGAGAAPGRLTNAAAGSGRYPYVTGKMMAKVPRGHVRFRSAHGNGRRRPQGPGGGWCWRCLRGLDVRVDCSRRRPSLVTARAARRAAFPARCRRFFSQGVVRADGNGRVLASHRIAVS